jgi:hypothetical protein
MKVKMKLDSARMKAFLIDHGEKIAVVVAACVLLYMTYSAFVVPRTDLKPGKMSSDAKSKYAAITNFEENKFVASEHDVVLPNPEYAVQVEKAMAKIDPDELAMVVPWNAPINETRVRRDEPAYYEPTDLRVAYNFGAVATKGEGSKYTGRQWVVVTGLVPYQQQVDEYKRLFDNALHKDPKLDTPQYATFAVQRAETTSADQPDAELKWVDVDVVTIYNEANAQFATERPDYTDKKYVDQAIADFCPPLVGKQHGEEVVHVPEIPFGVSAAPAPGEPIVPAEPQAPATGGRLGLGAAAPKEAEPAPGAAAGQSPKVVAMPVTNKLFRFFDYTVEHGKTYRYRAKLALNNPNKDVYRRFLKNPDLAKGDTRETKWSEPSPASTTPPDFRILAGEAKVSASPSIEPKARVMIIRWVPQEGVEVAQEFIVDRGTMLEFPDQAVTVPAPGGRGSPHGGSVTYDTDSLLIDVVGGDRLSDSRGRPFKGPSETLFMRADGQLAMRSAILGANEMDSYRIGPAPKAAADDAPADDGGAPMPGGGGLFDSILK